MPAGVRVWREPALWCVLLATVAHVVRQNAMDVGVFLGVALLIVLDARREPPDAPFAAAWLTRGRAALLCAAYAVAVLPMARTGWPMRLAVALPGVVALAVVLRSGRALVVTSDDDGGVRGLRGAWPWVAVLVLGCLFELYNWLNQPDPETDSYTHPTLSALVDPLLAGHVARAAAVAGWLAAGLWLFRILTGRAADGASP